MVRRFVLFTSVVLMGWGLSVSVAHANYGAKICKKKGYKCVKVKKGDSWSKLFPDSGEREIVMRLNRMNTRLRSGKVIAVPKKLSSLSVMDISPFPKRIEADKTNKIVVDQKKLAWGAYDEHGRLLKWGPMSGGRRYCSDVNAKCSTPSGAFRVFRKEGADCESSQFPIGEGGAPMPYCTFFTGGIAFHGSKEVPGYNASHGCVRVYTEDARWINTVFVDMGKTRVLVDKDLPKGIPDNGSGATSDWITGGGYRKGTISEFAFH